MQDVHGRSQPFFTERTGRGSKAGEAGSASEKAEAGGTDPRSARSPGRRKRAAAGGSEPGRALGASGGACATSGGHEGSAARRGCCQRRCHRCAPRAAPASSSGHFPANDSPWGQGSGGPWTKAPGKNPFLPGHRKRRQFPGLGHRRRLIRGSREWVRGRVSLSPEAWPH